MSSTEIIAEIQKLPVSEQEKVLAFFTRERDKLEGPEASVHHASDENADKAVDNVLRDRADLFRRLAQ